MSMAIRRSNRRNNRSKIGVGVGVKNDRDGKKYGRTRDGDKMLERGEQDKNSYEVKNNRVEVGIKKE